MNIKLMSKVIDVEKIFIDNLFLINDYEFVDLENRPHKTMKLPIHPEIKESFLCEGTKKYFLELLLDFADEYKDKYNINKDMSIRPNMQVSILESGEYMASHRDCNDPLKDNFIVMLYLNEDFDGGNVVLDEFGISIKPKFGLILAFHSYYMHHVSKLISGTRLNIGIGLFE